MKARLSPPWYVISLRPRGGHQALRRGATRLGAGFVALSPWALDTIDSGATRLDLGDALRSDVIVFTSPVAVRAAAALQPLHDTGQTWLAVGSTTAAALRRADVNTVLAPERMDSEGLLSLPVLRDLRGRNVGLVTAPDGRSLLATELARRGARVCRANVYRRREIALTPDALSRWQAAQGDGLVVISSAAALQAVLSQLTASLRDQLLQSPAVAASERLRQSAIEHGFAEVTTAAGPRPAQLLSSAVNVMATRIR